MFGSLILVVDDDPKIKANLELAFPEYKFQSALSVQAGLDELRKPNEIDLVIVDLNFKSERPDGLGLLEVIKKEFPKLGTFVLTGFGSKENLVKVLESKADDYADKPFDVEELRKKFKRFFDSRQTANPNDRCQHRSINRIVQLLEKNHEKFLTLQHASDLVMLSPKYISRLFKKEMQVSFVEFRTGLKMRYAKKMLKDASMTVNDIAVNLGYQNTASFIKMFKLSARCTPTEYREKAGRSRGE